jgi:hypothetical protein
MCCERILPQFGESANSKKKVRDALRPRTEPVPLQEGGDRKNHKLNSASFMSSWKLFLKKNNTRTRREDCSRSNNALLRIPVFIAGSSSITLHASLIRREVRRVGQNCGILLPRQLRA